MMAEDYSISWNYIVSRMETRFGISPSNNKDYSLYDLKSRIDLIWDEYFEHLKKKYERCRDCAYLVEKDGKWFCEDSNQDCVDVGWCIVEV